MAKLSRVVWSEGMYLGPHHFQAQNRFFESTLAFTIEHLCFQPYGLLACELDAEALTNGTLSLLHARGVFPDGLVFSMPDHDPLPSPVPIADLFPPTGNSALISLTIPVFRPDTANLSQEEGGQEATRFSAVSSVLADENTGIDETPIDLGRKNIAFAVNLQQNSDFVSLPIARVQRDVIKRFVKDEEFIPPCLQIVASPRLLNMLGQLIEILENKCQTISRPRDQSGASSSGFSAEGIANAWFLHCLNSSLGPLKHMLGAPRAHPEELYVEMARLAGALSTFGMEAHPNRLPLYDPFQLGECFKTLDRHIRDHLELFSPSHVSVIALENLAPFFYAGAATDERVLYRSRWIFAIRCAIGESELITSVPRLVKICSRDFIGRLVERALSGLALTHLPSPPPAVSPKVEYQYFSVDKDGPCWFNISKTRQVAIYVPGELPNPEIELSVILES